MNLGKEYFHLANQSIAEYERKALSFLSLKEKSDPEGVLRKGLIEEVDELIGTSPHDEDEIAKEIGDIIWYATAISNICAESRLQDTLKADEETLTLQEAYNKIEATKRLPISDEVGNEVDRSEEPVFALVIDALRLIDTLNPKQDTMVWKGADGLVRPSVHDAIRQLFAATGDYLRYVVNSPRYKTLDLDRCASMTLEKLAQRNRPVHVVAERDVSRVDSLRSRLSPDLWRHARSLAVSAYFTGKN